MEEQPTKRYDKLIADNEASQKQSEEFLSMRKLRLNTRTLYISDHRVLINSVEAHE